MSRRGPRAVGCFLRGLQLSLSKPYLAFALWLIQLMLSAALILPISNTLHALLDRSPAGEKMVANPDYGWWETVRRVHPDVLGNFPEIATGLISSEGRKALLPRVDSPPMPIEGRPPFSVDCGIPWTPYCAGMPLTPPSGPKRVV